MTTNNSMFKQQASISSNEGGWNSGTRFSIQTMTSSKAHSMAGVGSVQAQPIHRTVWGSSLMPPQQSFPMPMNRKGIEEMPASVYQDVFHRTLQ